MILEEQIHVVQKQEAVYVLGRQRDLLLAAPFSSSFQLFHNTLLVSTMRFTFMVSTILVRLFALFPFHTLQTRNRTRITTPSLGFRMGTCSFDTFLIISSRLENQQGTDMRRN
jgi:hypothetical protein